MRTRSSGGRRARDEKLRPFAGAAHGAGRLTGLSRSSDGLRKAEAGSRRAMAGLQRSSDGLQRGLAGLQSDVASQ